MPPLVRVVEPSTCWNSSKMRSLVVGRDPGPGVRDRDLEGTVGGSHVHRDLAGLGELDRVADQVEQHLRDPPVVALAERQAVLQRRP